MNSTLARSADSGTPQGCSYAAAHYPPYGVPCDLPMATPFAMIPAFKDQK
ncbi:hypothetical protein [Orrella daihaiensis]|uniref:Uncharacterized protein n=1 Tax=Orrella daihaiensis TaxID=2782176 RepID=A0ABY4ALZ9_9BURK|nr:hypothetical protein DHf2319_03390 [Orrella daihaiensis]